MTIKKTKHANIDYRKKKKILNKFHNFTFKMPRKGKDFTPQQKSAITRQWSKVEKVLDKGGKLDPSKYTFLPLKNAKRQEFTKGFVTTNKGIMYTRGGAKLSKDKKTNKYKVTVKYGKRRDLFIPLPNHIYDNIWALPDWLEGIYDKFGRYYNIAISVKGYRGLSYSLKQDFTKYAFDLFHLKGDDKLDINGVYLVPLSRK
jgi:hypothetical protein